MRSGLPSLRDFVGWWSRRRGHECRRSRRSTRRRWSAAGGEVRLRRPVVHDTPAARAGDLRVPTRLTELVVVVGERQTASSGRRRVPTGWSAAPAGCGKKIRRRWPSPSAGGLDLTDPYWDSVTVYGRSCALGAVERVQLGAHDLPAQRADGVGPRGRRAMISSSSSVPAGRGRADGSPGQYSPVKSASVRSANSSPTGPRWNQVLVSVGGENCVPPPARTESSSRAAPAVEVLEDLGVELLDPAEAAELALGAVPVAVVIAVLGGQLAAGEIIDHLHPLDDLDREGQRRLPAGLRLVEVRQVEFVDEAYWTRVTAPMWLSIRSRRYGFGRRSGPGTGKLLAVPAVWSKVHSTPAMPVPSMSARRTASTSVRGGVAVDGDRFAPALPPWLIQNVSRFGST